MISGDDFLVEAKSLMTSVNSNSFRRRTVASRTYYAAFHKVLNLAKELGYRCDYKKCKTEKPCGSHEDLIDWLQNYPHRQVQAAASTIRKLKTIRVQADYGNPEREIELAELRAMVKDVEFFFAETCPDLELLAEAEACV